MGNLKFGDIYTKDLDLIIQAPPVYNFPAKDVTVEHIPGRNGDLIIDNKCWQNVERTYSIASVFRPGTNFINNAEKLIKWSKVGEKKAKTLKKRESKKMMKKKRKKKMKINSKEEK